MSEFDDYAQRYQTLLRDPLRDRFASDSSFFHLRKWELIRDFFARSGRDTRQMDWLDVGCGQGELLDLGASSFRQACGCDPSDQMLAKTGAGAAEVRQQIVPADLPYPDRSFDFVTAVCVYHHVHGADRALLTQSIRRVLRPGGVFCMIEHNPWNPVTRAIVRRCPVDVDAELLTAPAAARLVRAGGLRPAQTSYFLYLPPGLYRFLGGVETALQNIPAGGQYALFSRLAAW